MQTCSVKQSEENQYEATDAERREWLELIRNLSQRCQDRNPSSRVAAHDSATDVCTATFPFPTTVASDRYGSFGCTLLFLPVGGSCTMPIDSAIVNRVGLKNVGRIACEAF